jgi:hypothetical protein
MSHDLVTASYDIETGAALWDQIFRGPAGHDFGRSIKMCGDGSTVFVAGGFESTKRALDPFVICYSTSTGEEMGSARYDRSRRDDDFRQLAVGANGHIYTVGFSQASAKRSRMVVVAYVADAAIGVP